MTSLLSVLPTQKSATLRDAIVTVLSDKWPLTAKEVHRLMVRESGRVVSYQATHKLLVRLVEESVLQCTEKKYQLNLDWIDRLKKSAESLHSSYVGQNGFEVPFADAHRHDHVQYVFPTTIELGRFLLFHFFGFPGAVDKPIVARWRHTYSTIGLSKEEIAQLREALAVKRFYLVTHTSKPLDLFFGKALQSMGANVKHGIECASEYDVIVVGDYVCKILFPTAYKKEWDDRVERVQDVNKFDLNSLLEAMQARILNDKISIERNPAMADQIREETLAYFR